MSGEVVVPEAPPRSTSIMQLPPSIAKLGVQIVEDAQTGGRAVVIPPAIQAQVNVLMPVTSFAQSDPNFTPSIRVVQLDPVRHAYQQQGKKLAPSKQGLEVLAQCAGLLYSKAERVPRALLFEGQRYAYKGIVGIRRSDGTVERIEREYAWNEEAERADIEEAVRKQARQHPDWAPWKDAKDDAAALAALIEDEIHKRWLKELKDGAAKAESKAILRAIRAALQIPHTFTQEEFAKPFMVVGYSFTPDLSDPVAKRMVIERGLDASAQIYGRGDEVEVPEFHGELAPAAEAIDVIQPEPDIEPEPEPEPEPGFDPDVVAAAAAFVVPDGFKQEGKGISELWNASDSGKAYVRWLASDAVQGAVHNAARVFLDAVEGEA